jgi:hypothetical protein
MLFAVLTIVLEFNFMRLIEYFKFLKTVFGRVFLTIFYASMFSYQYTVSGHTNWAIGLSATYYSLSVVYVVLFLLKPLNLAEDIKTVAPSPALRVTSITIIYMNQSDFLLFLHGFQPTSVYEDEAYALLFSGPGFMPFAAAGRGEVVENRFRSAEF